MATQGGARPGAGQQHLSKDVAAPDRAPGRAIVNQLMSDGGVQPIEMVVKAGRFHYERARNFARSADDARVVEKDEEKAERFSAKAAEEYDRASAHGAKAAPFFTPKLASIDHTGIPASPTGAGGVNLTIVAMFNDLAGARALAAPILEAAIKQAPKDARVTLEAEPLPASPQTLEEIADVVKGRLQAAAARIAGQPRLPPPLAPHDQNEPE